MADSLALNLTGFDSSNPIPQIAAELRFAQGETAGDLGPKRVLILGPKTSSGSITADTQVVGPLSDEADFITYAGAGSPAHRMARGFLANNKSSEVWLLCPTAATGSAAVDKIVLATTAAANGVLSVWICGEQIDVPITTGDTATVIGANLAQAINNRTWLPLTGSNSSGTVTITGKIAGVILNSVRIRAKITGTGVATTVNFTADTAFGASGESGAAIGVGVIDLTAALATLLPRKFDTILCSEQSATAIDALLDQVYVQAEPSTGFRQKVYVGGALTPSAAATLASGTSMNRARADLINAEECPQEHYLLCAIVAGAYLKFNSSDPSYSFDGFGTKSGQNLVGLSRPYSDGALPTTTELKSMLNQGVTPLSYTDGGQPFIVRAVTTQCKSGSNFDYRVRDAHIVTVGDRFTADAVAKLAASPWTKITRDPVGSAKEPGPEFATPRRVKAMYEQLLSDYASNGWIDPAKLATAIEGTQVGQDPIVPSRMNSSIPLYSAILLHQHALLVKESSAAA
jgi:phage tail sheath gpL-like